MSRTVGSSGVKTEAAIRAAALKLISAQGYELTSLRHLAAEVGILPAAIYRYFPSKTHLLCALIEDHIQELQQGWAKACPKTDDPEAQLRAFVSFHVKMHAGREKEIFVADRELRSLPPEDYKRMSDLLKGYERILTDILQRGMDQGVFVLEDASVATYAFLAMMTGVCHWFQDGGRVSRQRVVEYYTQLVLHGALGRANGQEATADRSRSVAAG
ncbi:TetR/AcrR family transcriptional regulator [Phenylobacterium sp.]|uniref:TetR/AcrR family transcriptional regulator n=1 Tax=Phenylobacterium sp. TaxID=1871053 RepID=UPI0035AE5864